MKQTLIVKTLQQDKGYVKGEAEETTVLKATLRKEAYTSIEDGENLREGTGDPWGTLTLRSFDQTTFDDLGDLKPGDKIVITVERRGKSK